MINNNTHLVLNRRVNESLIIDGKYSLTVTGFKDNLITFSYDELPKIKVNKMTRNKGTGYLRSRSRTA
jgi:sRNA-binding carbon storage regulator CsrA